MKKYAVISGDIISSTSLESDDKQLLESYLERLILDLKESFQVYGRVVKGDYVEFVLSDPGDALRVALAIKSFVKSIPVEIEGYQQGKKRAKFFRIHGIRLAIGYGALTRYDPQAGIIDGEAIYLSGRLINANSSHHKERIVIKSTLFFASAMEEMNRALTPVLALLDVLLAKATARQSEVLYLKLKNNNEESIATQLGIDQSVVNRHSTSVGWNAIESAADYFSDLMTRQTHG